MDVPKTPNVLERVSILRTTSKWHDIEFHLNDTITGNVVVAKAHRLILASCSPVFEALCFGPLAEKDVVSVPDIEPIAFNNMLEYLYTDKVHLPSVQVACSLYYAAKKYLVHSLCSLVSSYLLQNIDDSNCLDMFKVANILDDTDLLSRVWDYICSHLNNIQKYASVDNLSSDLLVKLVNETMINGDEITLVLLAQMWAEYVCDINEIDVNGENIRNILMKHGIFQQIRWRLLNQDEFSLILPGLLTDDELMTFKGPKKRKSSNYLEMPRIKPPLRLIYLHRYVEKKTEKLRMNLPDNLKICTTVCVNRSITLQGIFVCARVLPLMFNPLTFKPPEYLERLSITIKKSSSLVDSQEFEKYVEYGSPSYVKLKNPLRMHPDVSYDLELTLFMSVCQYEFALLNRCGKVPAGLTVDFHETANIGFNGQFIASPKLGAITGLQFCW